MLGLWSLGQYLHEAALSAQVWAVTREPRHRGGDWAVTPLCVIPVIQSYESYNLYADIKLFVS